MRGPAAAACRECAQPGFGGPSSNRFTAWDAIGQPVPAGAPGTPRVYVNLANLTLFVQVTDLAFGGPAPALALERSFNMDDTRPGPFGTGWSFSLGESLAPQTDGTLVLCRASGRIDRFAPAAPSGYFALTATSDTLSKNSDGTFTLRTAGSMESRRFGANGKLQAIEDAGATRVALDYDPTGRLATARYRGRELHFSYGDTGRIDSVSDAAGRTVTYSYTDDGRLTRQVNSDGRAVDYQYNDAGLLTGIGDIRVAYGGEPEYVSVAAVTAPGLPARKYETALAATQIRVTDGKGDAAIYVSSPSGLLLSVTDAAGGRVSYGYDSAGRRTSVVNAAGETSRFTYDAAGNLVTAVDAPGNRWSADYSPAGLSRLTDPNGNAWTFQYDAAGFLSAVNDPVNGRLAATRTPAGQIAAITNARGNKSSYSYDDSGLLAGFTDALGAEWKYEYDGAARVSSQTAPGGAAVAVAYDASGRPGELTAGEAHTSFDYSGFTRDSLNRLTAYTDSFGNRVTWSYDDAGRLSAMTLPGDKTVTYAYDHAGRLSQVADWLGNFALYRYDAAGWPASVSVSGGPVTIYQYDTGRRLRAVVSTGPDGAPLAGYRYTLDANGNRTAVSALEPADVPADVAAHSYSFDAAGRPESRDDGEGYRYDARGNLAAIEGRRNITFEYDPFGRLLGPRGDVQATCAYDAGGLRVSRTAEGAERRFVYDPSGARPRLIMETGDDNEPLAWYVWGLGLLWKVTPEGAAYFYHFDGDGNVVAVSSTTEGVVNRYRYDPSGRLVSAEESVENPFHSRGEAGWVDDGNGLIFTGSDYRLAEPRLALPSAADFSPPAPSLLPRLSGAGACFLDGVAACAFATGRNATR